MLTPRSKAWRTRATASAVLLPVPSPRRLNPPQPSPATLTLSPVLPRMTYSMTPTAGSGTSGAGATCEMGSVQADADQVAEEAREPGAIGLRQWRGEQRGDVGAQMVRVAGAEEHDIDPGLVPHKAIGRVDDAPGTALVDQKAERIGCLGEPLRYLARGRQLAHRCGELSRPREDVAHREHQQRPDPVLPGQREDPVASVLMHHVKPDHRDVPRAVGNGKLQHLVLGVVRCRLGDGEVTELALGLLLQQGRRDDAARVLVGAGCDTVQLIDVDDVGGELAQRVVERGDRTFGAGVGVADAERRLGGDHDLVAWDGLQRLAEQRFGAVSGGRVEQIDPEVEGLTDQPDGLGLAPAGAETEPAEPATAETRDTDPEPGPAECHIFHQRNPIDSQGIAATTARATTSAPI